MQKSDIQPTNYCSHAIEDITAQAKAMTLEGRHREAAKFLSVAGLLLEAVKFMLPNCAELLDRDAMNDTHLELFRLPYRVVAFESPWIKDHTQTEINGFGVNTSTRRIALCWENRAGFNPLPECRAVVKPGEEEGGVFVLPIYYVDQHKFWTVATGGLYIPKDFRLPEDFQEPKWSDIARNSIDLTDRQREKGYRFVNRPFVLMVEWLPDLLKLAGGDHARMIAQIQIDARDELLAATQGCCVLNCSNVETVEYAPTKAMNAARAARGKPPFFTYKVLQLTNPGARTAGSGGGTHASPRMHLRRGHLRRKNEKHGGGTVWINNTMVNAGSPDGQVAKDYSIRSARPANPAPGPDTSGENV